MYMGIWNMEYGTWDKKLFILDSAFDIYIKRTQSNQDVLINYVIVSIEMFYWH